MSSRWRRFEVLLPLQFNDGRDVPADWLAEAVLEIVDHLPVTFELLPGEDVTTDECVTSSRCGDEHEIGMSNYNQSSTRKLGTCWKSRRFRERSVAS
jgi:hypothetical protein